MLNTESINRHKPKTRLTVGPAPARHRKKGLLTATPESCSQLKGPAEGTMSVAAATGFLLGSTDCDLKQLTLQWLRTWERDQSIQAWKEGGLSCRPHACQGPSSPLQQTPKPEWKAGRTICFPM
jgi:hypothetical protein